MRKIAVRADMTLYSDNLSHSLLGNPSGATSALKIGLLFSPSGTISLK